MIEVQHISKSFNGAPVVQDVSFKVHPGEVLVLLGTSGSGKTTTLRMINRLVEKDGGKIYIHSEDVDQLTPYELRRRIGYVIQSIGLFPHYTIEQNIAVVPKLLGWSTDKIKTRINELLRMISLPSSIRDRKPHELSGGQQQRVGIARALAGDPSLILMDEPFGALDPITRQELQNEFIALEGAINKAIILVTHDVSEAFRLGDRVAVMDSGRLIQIGTPRELLFSPANEFVKSFLGHQPIQLELDVITLRDLTPFLSEAEPMESAQAVSAESSLSEVYQGSLPVVSFHWQGKTYFSEAKKLPEVYFSNRQQLIHFINASG